MISNENWLKRFHQALKVHGKERKRTEGSDMYYLWNWKALGLTPASAALKEIATLEGK